MSPRIVYHATVEDEPPHNRGYPFHAGTRQAAHERIEDDMEHGFYVDEPQRVTASYHAYEIDDNAPMSRRTWEDPIWEDETKAVPEHKENRIYPYINEVEDRGSTSYVIPSSFVGKHVRHLGVQFTEFYDLKP